MIVVDAKATIITPIVDDNDIGSYLNAREDAYNAIERAARNCYQSTNGSPEKQDKFIRGLVQRGHFAMLEHAGATVEFVVDRGVSHEIVRHRLASYSQESTRYCDYGSEKFHKQITVIKPCFFREGSESYTSWRNACLEAEAFYNELIAEGNTPEMARSVLPTSTKTTLVMKADMTEWRHFFKLRAIGVTGKPHPQMREVAVPLLKQFAAIWPALFEDIEKELEDE